MLCAVCAVVVALALTSIDDTTVLGGTLLFEGGPEGARALLSAIITSMISFTALVFSITIVVLQLTSSQFSPRILRTFVRDRYNQLCLGVFIATFVYALVVLRSVRGTSSSSPHVPQLAITVAVLLVLVSVGLFLGYIHHIAQSIRAAIIISGVGDDTRELLERRYPADGNAVELLDTPGSEPTAVPATALGVVQRIDDGALARWADHHDATVCLARSVGEFVPAGALVMRVHGAAPDKGGRAQLLSHVLLARERSLDEDVGFGFRQLVDIAERALSPGTNDPTTAVQVIDQIHDLLRRLATRHLPPRQQCDDDGRLTLSVPEPSFATYLALGVYEIAHWGKDSPRIQRRLRLMLTDLHHVALAEHQPPLRDVIARYHEKWASFDSLDPLTASDTGLR